MRNVRTLFPALALAGGLAAGACGGGHDRSANTAGGDVVTSRASTVPAAPAAHHSKLAGAAVGAIAGHMLGGHAVAGAAAGALVQHERNKRTR